MQYVCVACGRVELTKFSPVAAAAAEDDDAK
jgi:hypothetical protein